MPKTTKAAQKAVNKYIANNYDRINVTVQKGKKEEYKAAAETEGKSLNQYITDCLNKEGREREECDVYTVEMVELLGEVYYELLGVMNKDHHDPYGAISNKLPMKCLVMILPKAMTLGIPNELNEKIGKVMNMIDMEDMQKMMTSPMPREYFLAWERGKRKHCLKKYSL